ncbi:replication termination factor 2 isoform X2 [Lepeophtheirus salmonis]|nr:replication termination factor 2-like isoform X2 [Lepeophtheirus salmonis]
MMACQLGRLYNKESVIRYLLDRKDSQKNVNKLHIKSLKDVIELKLTPNPSVKDKTPDSNASPYICPITGLEMSGRFKFVFDWTSGRVISERALKIVKNDPADHILEENLIILNPEDDDFVKMNTAMESRRARNKVEKKKGKRAMTEDATNNEKSNKKSKNELSKSKTSTATTSLQSDSSKSEVYKSIFSSHPIAQNQPKGNWVTFDPRYN